MNAKKTVYDIRRDSALRNAATMEERLREVREGLNADDTRTAVAALKNVLQIGVKLFSEMVYLGFAPDPEPEIKPLGDAFTDPHQTNEERQK